MSRVLIEPRAEAFARAGIAIGEIEVDHVRLDLEQVVCVDLSACVGRSEALRERQRAGTSYEAPTIYDRADARSINRSEPIQELAFLYREHCHDFTCALRKYDGTPWAPLQLARPVIGRGRFSSNRASGHPVQQARDPVEDRLLESRSPISLEQRKIGAIVIVLVKARAAYLSQRVDEQALDIMLAEPGGVDLIEEGSPEVLPYDIGVASRRTDHPGPRGRMKRV